MTAHKLSMADEAVITDLLAKNSRLEEEIEYLRNEIASMKTGPHSELLKENKDLRHQVAALVYGLDDKTISYRRDAERYRWLRSNSDWEYDVGDYYTDVTAYFSVRGEYNSLDAAIDAKMEGDE